MVATLFQLFGFDEGASARRGQLVCLWLRGCLLLAAHGSLIWHDIAPCCVSGASDGRGYREKVRTSWVTVRYETTRPAQRRKWSAQLE